MTMGSSGSVADLDVCRDSALVEDEMGAYTACEAAFEFAAAAWKAAHGEYPKAEKRSYFSQFNLHAHPFRIVVHPVCLSALLCCMHPFVRPYIHMSACILN
jgi:hypothetical protein